MNHVRIPRRSIDGVLMFDKPLGWTSNDAVQRVRRVFRAEKVGHTGTLDPLATGLLPLLFGEATKFSADLLDADKTYVARVRLGAVTSTGDLEGEVLRRADDAQLTAVTQSQVDQVLQMFLGDQQQVPPMYSALKRDGRALYEYARAGIEVEREARSIHIAAISLCDNLQPCVAGDGSAALEFSMRVTCSKGTYIRVLAEDIGAKLGCGAHLSGLRRTAVGGLALIEGQTHTWEGLEALQDIATGAADGLLSPVDSLLGSLPAIELGPELARRFCQGQRLPLGPRPEQGRVRVYRNEPRGLLGTGLLNNDGTGHSLLCPERLIREHRT